MKSRSTARDEAQSIDQKIGVVSLVIRTYEEHLGHPFDQAIGLARMRHLHIRSVCDHA